MTGLELGITGHVSVSVVCGCADWHILIFKEKIQKLLNNLAF